ncbi:hypothetical protein JWV37_10820 [Sulfurospirillum sp. T05]|uniref:Uncharacterized protein n=1 Tax=Sulfurospirillum tamanense TaxID=2813362 RepID=A0ABS2WUF5_9BACT|nr:hypothetical protein [Sulfurospirillum tamanensis]MBN2965275.1 hypothetical protein [Sulfurospirillum tamanensis]
MKKIVFSLCLAAGLAFGNSFFIENDIAVMEISHGSKLQNGSVTRIAFDVDDIVQVRQVRKDSSNTFELILKVGDGVESYVFYDDNLFTRLVLAWRKK